jgi:hypothetical protein
MVIALLLAAAAPSAEALALGRQIAEAGTMASFIELVQAKETDELIESHPELSDADKARIRSTARSVYQSGRERLMQASARAYAERLSVADMRDVVAFQKSHAGQAYRGAIPAVIAATVESVGEMDFKGDVTAAYCKQTGKLCAAK